MLLAAGDIARCSIIGGARATARLLDRFPGTILTLGDNAYESGTPREFEECYAPTWGRYLARTRPALAASYSFVNPIIGMLLGVTLGSEVVTSHEWWAVTVIVCGVILLILGKRQ